MVKTLLLGVSIIRCLHKFSFLSPHIFFLLWAHFSVCFVIPLLQYSVTHSLFSGSFHFPTDHGFCNPLCLLHRTATRYSPPSLTAVATLSVPPCWSLQKILHICSSAILQLVPTRDISSNKAGLSCLFAAVFLELRAALDF